MSSKKVQTVTGDVNASELGLTLTHEHLSMDFSLMYVRPEKQPHMVNCPFTIQNLGWIQRNPFSHPYNLVLNDEESHLAVREEMKFFKSSGGRTIVENTTTGLGRNVAFLKQIAEETQLNIIAGAGMSRNS